MRSREVEDDEYDPREVASRLEQSTEVIEELQEALAEERRTSASLREQVDAVDYGRERRQGEGLKWFFSELWSYPQSRVAVVGGVAAFWLWAYSRSGDAGATDGTQNLGSLLTGQFALPVNLAFASCVSWLFCKWAEAEYREGGPAQLLMKCGVGLLGFVTAFAWFFDSWWIGSWFQGGPSGSPAGAFALLLLTVLVAMSKAARRAATSRHPVAQFFRDWY